MNFFEIVSGRLPASELAKIDAKDLAQEIEKGGGTRRFFRASRQGVPAIICIYDDSKAENFLYAGIADFMQKIGVPAPKIFFHDAQTRALVMEDFGATDLWTLREEKSPECKAAYQSALAGIAKLHRDGLSNLGETRIMRDGFNADYYKWEQDYFLVNAVEKGYGIHTSAELADELSTLTQTLLALPPQLVHRDFQSQNILWSGARARFIDFQGMRVGTGWYDVASLLFDPYVEIDDTERSELFQFYCDKMSIPQEDCATAEKTFYLVATQRLMQAIGAYFFLSTKGGKPRFRKFALPALKNLKITLEHSGTLPRLSALVREITEREKTHKP